MAINGNDTFGGAIITRLIVRLNVSDEIANFMGNVEFYNWLEFIKFELI